MVSSNKKKRGQQRKAANKIKNNGDPDVDHQAIARCSASIRKANSLATEVLVKGDNLLAEGDNSETTKAVLVEALPYVVNFLKRCEHKTFSQVVANAGGNLRTPSTWIEVLKYGVLNVGKCRLEIAENIGPLVRSRSMCADTTCLFFQSNKHWQEGILPFVHLISDIISTDGEVVNSLLKYEGLLASIIQWNFWDNEHRPDMTRLLNMEKCTEIVALGRAIVKKLVINAANNPSSENRQLLDSIGCMPIVSKDYDYDQSMATTSTIYYPDCISYTSGLIRCMKEEGSKEGIWCIDQIDGVLNILAPLMYEGDCIDKDVITRIMDLGTNHVQDYANAVVVARLSAGMLRKGTDKTCDTRTAFAIRYGLIEMCLNFIGCFGAHMSCEKGSDSRCQCTRCLKSSLYNHIASMFKNINDVVLHQKTAKAIRYQSGSIEEKLVSLEAAIQDGATLESVAREERLATDAKETYLKKKRLDLIKDVKVNEGFTADFVEALNDEDLISLFNDEEKAGYEALSTPERISGNPKCKELLDMVRSILNLNGSYCCRCNKQLSRTEVLRCNGCSSMVYCSRACQKEDWSNGHKLTCSKSITDENNGQFQGRVHPESITECARATTKLEELEVNCNMIQLKLFLNNTETILNQATALGIPLCDCVVLFDLRKCPIKVKTFAYTHNRNIFNDCDCDSCKFGYFESREEREGFEASRSKENITCCFVSSTYMGDNVFNQDGKLVEFLTMQRLFPHEWLMNKKV